MKLLVITSIVVSMAVFSTGFAGEKDAYELGGWMNASAEEQGACLRAREELELAEEYLEDATQEVMVQYAEKMVSESQSAVQAQCSFASTGNNDAL
jgi:hypothetical protein